MRHDLKTKVTALVSAAALAVTGTFCTVLSAQAYTVDPVTEAGVAAYQANGLYTVSPKKTIVYAELPKNDKMIGFSWEDFGIPSTEKIQKVEFNLSTTDSKIGKWQGAIGTSTSVAPDYWSQGDDMEESFTGKTGTITWTVDKATSAIIQTQYGGEVKIGFWWVDCKSVTVDSINVYTDKYTGGTGATTTTPGASTPSAGGGHVTTLNQAVDYSKLPKDDKMFGWEWADLGVSSTEKIQKVEINISTTASKIGKWQGALGSSTSIAPEYWTQTDDMEESFTGKTGTITWDVDKATQAIIQTQYGGEFKLGVWWIDCTTFTVDSVVVYTDKTGTGAATTTQATTTKATTTTTKSSTTVTTTKAIATTTKASTTVTTTKVTTAATTTAAPVEPGTPSAGGETISGVSFGKEIDLSKYKDITSIDFVFSSTPSNGSGAVVFGQWVKSQDYQMSDLKNNTLTVSVDQDYPSVTINKYYSDTDTSLVSVVVHTKGGSAQVTTTKATTTQAQPSATTTKATTTQAQPSATTTKATTTQAQPSATTTKATTTAPKATTTTKAPTPADKKAGDVNEDGKISLADVIQMSKMLSNGTSNANADVNGDGIFNAADLQALLEKIIQA